LIGNYCPVFSQTKIDLKENSAASSSKAKASKNKKKVSFESFDVNYQKAKNYYDKEKFLSAAALFEQLYPLSVGTPYADTILFMFADSYYKNGDYQMASFHFKEYTRRFPYSNKAELAALMVVKSIYNVSPYYSLDQYETDYAIEEITHFISVYPNSKYMEECNLMLDELRNKLAKKAYEIAKLYYRTERYQAAQISVKNFIKDYSSSMYADDALFLLIQNNLDYAKKSINAKKRERYIACLDAFSLLKNTYPDSPFISQAASYIIEAEKFINKKTN
jgi:outer membrane protein assembly factor BamD